MNTIREDGFGKTLVYELDPETKERVWEVKFNITDTHDVDMINGDQLLVANCASGTTKTRRATTGCSSTISGKRRSSGSGTSRTTTRHRPTGG